MCKNKLGCVEKNYEHNSRKIEEWKKHFLDREQVSDKIFEFLYKYNETMEIAKARELCNSTILNSPKLKNANIKTMSYKDTSIVFEVVKDNRSEKLVFDIETQKFIEFSRETQIEATKKIEEAENLLDAMDYIFYKNNQDWFGKLNDEDILKTNIYDKGNLKIQGKNLRDLQILFVKNLDFLLKNKKQLNDSQVEKLQTQQKKYLKILMWVWDVYEGWAKYLLDTKDRFETIAENIVNGEPLTEVFVYMAELHQKIDYNNHQSTSVAKSYKMLMDYLSQKLFDRLVREKASEKDFVIFSQLLTGRDGTIKKWEKLPGSIDGDLRNSTLALQALCAVFLREWGLFENMNIATVDPELKNVQTDKVLEWLEKELRTSLGDEKYTVEEFLIDVQFPELLQCWWKECKELSFENQSRIAVLKKLTHKIKAKRVSDLASRRGYLPNKKMSPEDIVTLMKEVWEDYINDTVKRIDDLFSSDNPLDSTFWNGKTAEEFNLKWPQKEAFDLFKEINGTGMFDLSDDSIAAWKKAAKIWVIVAAAIGTSILLPPASVGFIVSDAAAGAVASGVSWIVFPKGYDSEKEAAWDLSTDVALGAGTWAIWWGMTKAWAPPGMSTLKRSTAVWVTDVALGMWAEMGRVEIMDSIFHDQDMIIDTEDNNSLEELYKNSKK